MDILILSLGHWMLYVYVSLPEDIELLSSSYSYTLSLTLLEIYNGYLIIIDILVKHDHICFFADYRGLWTMYDYVSLILQNHGSPLFKHDVHVRV